MLNNPDQAQLNRIEQQQERIISMLQQLLYPATCMTIQDQAEAISMAIASGDKAAKKRVLAEINKENKR
jgi:hypothetical protein